MERAGARFISTAAAGLAGASAWVSLGTLAVTGADTRERIVALPPLWLLGLLIMIAVVGARLAGLTTNRARALALTGLLWLPYMPGRIPVAFLIWQGPIEALVWLCVLVGLAVGLPGRRPAVLVSLASNASVAPWLAGVLAATCYVGGSMALADRLPGGDEPHYLIITQSLLRDGDLQIQNNHDRIDYLSFYPNELKPHFIVRGLNGQIYSAHAPGLPAIVLPGFALWGSAGARATVIAMTAAAAGLAWRTAFLMTASPGAAWLGWAAVFLTTPFFVHGFTVFPDGPGALCVMAGVWLLIHVAVGRGAGPAVLVFVGAVLAALPWLHSRFSLPVLCLGAAIGARLLRDRHWQSRVLWFFSIPLASALAWLGFFWAIWGTPNPSAPWDRAITLEWRNIAAGTAGLLLDQRFGLVATAPVYVCATAGMVALARRHLRVALELVAVAVPYVLMVSAFEVWWGGFAGPGRYLVAILPLAVLPIACLWSQGSSAARALTLLLLLTSIAMLLPRLLVDGGALTYAEVRGTDPLLQWVMPSVDLPSAFPEFGETPWQDSVVLTLAAIVTALVIASGAWRRRQSVAVDTWTFVCLCGAAVLMLGCTGLWRVHHRDGLAPGKSQSVFLSEWDPAWQSTDVQWRPPFFTSPARLMRRIDIPMVRSGAKAGFSPGFDLGSVAPADYEIAVEAVCPMRGELLARVGDTDMVLERWRLEDVTPAHPTLRLRLPLPVSSLHMRGDESASACISAIRLHVSAFGPRPRRGLQPVHRAARFGAVRAYFFDDRAYLEPSGFWTGGEARTEVAFDQDPADASKDVTLVLQSGPVPTTADLVMENWTRRVVLTAHQREEVKLPVAAGVQTLSIQTGPMFLPVQHDPTTRDFRHLGVWVEVH